MYPEPDLSQYMSSCDIDFAKFFIKKAAPLPDSLNHAISTPLRKGDADGMLLTLHDPKPIDFKAVESAFPTAQFAALEVFFDLKPKKPSTLAEREAMLRDIQQWILSHLYPWNGNGLQVATRVSRGRGHSEPLYNDVVERRPLPSETMYFGHSKQFYADPALPNFAFMRMYIKKADRGGMLIPEKWRTRVEVNLNDSGCAAYGLTTPSSLFKFDFRALGSYLHFFKPTVKAANLKNLRRFNPKMATLLETSRKRMAETTLRDAGAHTGSREKLINLNGRHRHPKANRMIRYRLDDLTRKYRNFNPKTPYGSEWGSW